MKTRKQLFTIKQPIYILGLNEGACASATLLRDGEIIASACEERFTRVKNQWGFPKNAIAFCYAYAKIIPSQIDLVVLSYKDPYVHFTQGKAKEKNKFAPALLLTLRYIAPTLEYHIPSTRSFFDAGRTLYYRLYQSKNQQIQTKEISVSLGIPAEKIMRMDHHLAHAYTAYFANPERSYKPTLVFTCDGAGDEWCATVHIVEKNIFKRIAATKHAHSLGLLYAYITSYLGLKAHEDEYKVMGLAPYSQKKYFFKLYTLFTKLIWVHDLMFHSFIPSRHFGLYLKGKLHEFRFDAIAGAIQSFTEDLLMKWIRNTIAATHIHTLVFSGGVFQNVKANQKIAALPQVKKTFFMPSPGDETNSIGACYYGFSYICKKKNMELPIHPITNLYLGPSYSQKEIQKTLAKFSGLKVIHPDNMANTIANLLAKGEIVARFAGRMEMGTRALGNRSILADPRNRDVVEKINKLIKMRDFWMPFAPTILAEYANTYIKNPKGISSSFMMVTFDTTLIGEKMLAAAVHPYDKTTRPQILKKKDNPSYYQIIEEFRKLTGVGALLNTSFNLHGEPIVATPKDALATFTRSGLRYLFLEDLLITRQ